MKFEETEDVNFELLKDKEIRDDFLREFLDNVELCRRCPGNFKV